MAQDDAGCSSPEVDFTCVLVCIQQGAGWVSPLRSLCGATRGRTRVPPVPAAVCNLCRPGAAGHASRVTPRLVVDRLPLGGSWWARHTRMIWLA